MPQMWALFAVLLGTGGLLVAGVRRRRAVHAVAAGLAQPAARRPGRDGAGGAAGARLRPVARCCRCSRPLVGQTYGVGDALVHGVVPLRRGLGALQPGVSAVDGVQRRVASAADRAAPWRSCWRLVEPSFGELSRYSLFGVMSGGDAISVAADCRGWDCSPARPLSAAMLYAAAVNIARQDF